MPHFVHDDSATLLSASMKVMTTTLHTQAGVRIAGGRELQRHVFAQHVPFVRARRHVLIVRDPFARVVSFYRDKFLQDSQLRGPFPYDGWQECQRLFFPHIGVSRGDAPETIGERMRTTTFDRFVELLPAVFRRDAHLIPQSEIRFVPLLRTRGLPLRFDRVVHLERAAEVETLTECGVDATVRRKNTDGVPFEPAWTDVQRRTVARIYHDDLRSFGYPAR